MHKVLQKSHSFLGLALLLMATAGSFGPLPISSASAADGAAPYLGVGISPTIRKFELHSGDEETVQMTVRNRTKYAENFKLYAAPYNILNSNYSQPDYEKQTSYSYLSKWITFEQTEYSLEPESEMTVEFKIAVPDSVPDGTQYAAVFAETGHRDGDQTIGVRTYGRVGMVVKAKMLDGKNKESAEIVKQKIAAFQPEAPLKTNFVIENSGNVEYEIQSHIIVSDFFSGKEKYKSTWDSTSVYPESSLNVDINWDKSNLGIYKVTQEIKMMNGATVQQQSTVVAVPIWIMILFVLGIVAIIVNVVLIFVRRKQGGRRRTRRRRKGSMKL